MYDNSSKRMCPNLKAAVLDGPASGVGRRLHVEAARLLAEVLQEPECHTMLLAFLMPVHVGLRNWEKSLFLRFFKFVTLGQVENVSV